MNLRCQCCGEPYHQAAPRTRPACCREPHGMRTDVWLGLHCARCRKCPRHCACPREPVPVVAPEGWQQIAEGQS